MKDADGADADVLVCAHLGDLHPTDPGAENARDLAAIVAEPSELGRRHAAGSIRLAATVDLPSDALSLRVEAWADDGDLGTGPGPDRNGRH